VNFDDAGAPPPSHGGGGGGASEAQSGGALLALLSGQRPAGPRQGRGDEAAGPTRGGGSAARGQQWAPPGAGGGPSPEDDMLNDGDDRDGPRTMKLVDFGSDSGGGNTPRGAAPQRKMKVFDLSAM